METKQKLYTEEQVKQIVEKSRETGLTAEYLMLTTPPNEPSLPTISKQTSIDWLQECMSKHLTHEQKMQMEGLFQQARYIHKDEIMDAFKYGKWDWASHISDGKDSEDPAEYYNTTYTLNNETPADELLEKTKQLLNDMNNEYKPNFRLECAAGTYEADTFFQLVIEVLKHRFWHLRTHGKWMD